MAFLVAEVVSYTFTVLPVPILDSYIVEVETSFETFVPKPVIVWSPAPGQSYFARAFCSFAKVTLFVSDAADLFLVYLDRRN